MDEKQKAGGREMVAYEGKQSTNVQEEKQVQEYPAPLFTHKELCSDPGIFVEALRRFHSLMGTKFMIPVIGGKDLNLHLLYVEVTKRGGLEKVIMEKRWREVIAIFNFPPTTTSASFVLRKYYLSLLHHFEQVYFFGARGALVPPAETLRNRNPLCKFDDMVRSDPGPPMRRKRDFPPEILPVQTIPQIPNGHLSAESSSLHLQGSPRHGRPAAVRRQPFNAKEFEESNHAAAAAANARQSNIPRSAAPDDGADGFAASASIPPADGSGPSATVCSPIQGGACNFTVTGTIDGKFDYGYFVTVKLGSQLLHGLLYHIHPQQLGSTPSVFNPHRPVSSSPVNPVFQTPPPSSFAAATMENSNFSCIPATRSGGRRRRLKNRDPARPKPNRSAYNFFFAEKHFQLKAQCPHMEREYSKMIGESWSKITDEERKLYEDHARRDKERYRKEMQIYKERFNFSEPKQSQETPREVDVQRTAAVHDISQTIEIAHSKEAATLQRDARIAEDTIMEKHEIARRETQDYYIERAEAACPAETESSEKGPKIEEETLESGKEGMNSAMEIDMMKKIEQM